MNTAADPSPRRAASPSGMGKTVLADKICALSFLVKQTGQMVNPGRPMI